jgi:hypothetical protein
MKSDWDERIAHLCENCGIFTLTRRVEIYGAFNSAKRGYSDICFECHAPQVTFKGVTGGMYNSPGKLSEAMLAEINAVKNKVRVSQ